MSNINSILVARSVDRINGAFASIDHQAERVQHLVVNLLETLDSVDSEKTKRFTLKESATELSLIFDHVGATHSKTGVKGKLAEWLQEHTVFSVQWEKNSRFKAVTIPDGKRKLWKKLGKPFINVESAYDQAWINYAGKGGKAASAGNVTNGIRALGRELARIAHVDGIDLATALREELGSGEDLVATLLASAYETAGSDKHVEWMSQFDRENNEAEVREISKRDSLSTYAQEIHKTHPDLDDRMDNIISMADNGQVAADEARRMMKKIVEHSPKLKAVA